MRPGLWRWASLMGPVVVLAVLVVRAGTGPFLAGLRTIDGGALAAAVAISAVTTVCCAWRWTIVARGLGVELSLSGAVTAYYRSVFLNVTLPGGIVGDVHRGLSHGRAVRDVGRAVRAVAWERAAGQVVQIVLTAGVLLVLPSPVQPSVPLAVIAAAGAGLAVLLLLRIQPAGERSALSRLRGAATRDIRDALLARRAWPWIVVASALIVAGHALTFLIAARTAGTTAPVPQMLPIALLAMAAMVLPSIGGWGPREGVTAWAFGAAGLGVHRGVSTAVVYGVMVLVASLPGAAVLLASWLRGARFPGRRDRRLREEAARA